MLRHEYFWSLDKWSVGDGMFREPTDKTVYVRGVLDVPGAVDTHSAWVKILAHTNIIYPPEHLESYEANSPWGTPSSRVEEYKCPP